MMDEAVNSELRIRQDQLDVNKSDGPELREKVSASEGNLAAGNTEKPLNAEEKNMRETIVEARKIISEGLSGEEEIGKAALKKIAGENVQPQNEIEIDEVKLKEVYSMIETLNHPQQGMTESQAAQILQKIKENEGMLDAALRSNDHFYRILNEINISKRAFSNEFINFINSFYDRNLEYLNTKFQEYGENKYEMHQALIMKRICEGYRFGGSIPLRRERFWNFLIKNTDAWLEARKDPYRYGLEGKSLNIKDYSDVFSTMIGSSFDNENQVQNLLVDKFLRENKLAPFIIASMADNPNPLVKRKGEEMIKVLLNRTSLDVKVLEIWRHNVFEKEDGGVVRAIGENLKVISQLEAARPGICKVLRYNFGIRMFGRYPPELLIKQYDERERTDLKYGTVLGPLTDHNGAFYSYDNLLRNFAEKLGDGYSIRIVESGNIQAALNYLEYLRNTYGEMSFGILGGHGTHSSVQLGDELFGRGTLHLSDLKDKRFRRQFFKRNAPIVLKSCSTGKEGGIAQELSKLGLRVVGPNKNTGFQSVIPVFDQKGDLIDLDAVYSNAEKRKYVAGMAA